MKLKYDFEIMELGDEIMAVPLNGSDSAFKGVIKLNAPANYIFNLLKEDITEEQILSDISQHFETNDQLTDYVHEFLEKLDSEGFLSK